MDSNKALTERGVSGTSTVPLKPTEGLNGDTRLASLVVARWEGEFALSNITSNHPQQMPSIKTQMPSIKTDVILSEAKDLQFCLKAAPQRYQFSERISSQENT